MQQATTLFNYYCPLGFPLFLLHPHFPMSFSYPYAHLNFHNPLRVTYLSWQRFALACYQAGENVDYEVVDFVTSYARVRSGSTACEVQPHTFKPKVSTDGSPYRVQSSFFLCPQVSQSRSGLACTSRSRTSRIAYHWEYGTSTNLLFSVITRSASKH